jgi:SEC-C motif-containing protein
MSKKQTHPGEACPCGSGLAYELCCGPIHLGERPAASAEALMRSRYSAYALGLDDYLVHSWHPDTRPDQTLDSPVKWVGLEIVSTDGGGPDDDEGRVEFCASYLDGDRLEQMCERSRFVRFEGRWVYFDGVPGQGAPATARRIGRNEPCPCGSGEKFKRCCGK